MAQERTANSPAGFDFGLRWLAAAGTSKADFTTETQRTQSIHRGRTRRELDKISRVKRDENRFL
jgi:hypothetical protein